MKIKHVLAVAALAIGLGTAPVAKAAPMCVNQSVVVGLACSLGDLTFTFDAVSFTGMNPGSDALSLETPATGIAGGIAVLDFQLLATYPVDIHLVYSVTDSSGANITNLDSGFDQGTGTPPGMIVETGCSVNPLLNGGTCPSGDVLVTYTNTGGSLTSPGFGPIGTLWVDKDITDNGFSEFMDSVHETTTPPIPEPSSIALFGTGLLAAAGAVRRRLVK